ncbi:rpsP [Wigglesworthia glossinidia endosymbiont of Glossina brevipalpis]|uniref:Small ribosomal subunit protein bS16 n=1 Tax=Wigglesworthia glossinidia brevipalpis TaxID=36870 RepID=RS16_WIGBR|nr:RecName: Full=Small ribosomal subunit protein bS16; AltName: Full=30S ribosomal protein S16 [Wigglesworthia glossinidia endosymbiont of Glossina brevipalpis]BAC24395.1 rpsP [Wigglesworthia glossinidia endosymbiont of Glossina brevipalpis]
MVIIRLSRKGSKNKPFYQIVASDNRKPRDGKFIEKLGFFNPISIEKSKKIFIKTDRINLWMSKGAKLSDRVKNLLHKYKK